MLKKKFNRYNMSRRLQVFTYFVLAVLLVLAGMKTVRVIEKNMLVDSGFKLYDEKKWLEAEETLQKAESNSDFFYKDSKVKALLNKLCWVTDYKEELKKLYGDLKESEQLQDYDKFQQLLQCYEELKLDQLEDWQRDYLLIKFPIETVIEDCWKAFEKEMESDLQNPLTTNKYDWAKKHIQEVPEKYFTQDKAGKIKDLFMSCDMQLFQQIKLSDGSFSSMLRCINSIYEVNRECQFDTIWLTDEVRKFVIEKLKEADQPMDEETLELVKKSNPQYADETNSKGLPETIENDKENTEAAQKLQALQKSSESFLQMVNDYYEVAAKEYFDISIDEVISCFISRKTDEIETLIAYRYYDEAIKGYEMLKDWGDYTDEIAKVEKLREYTVPWVLLSSGSQYPVYKAGNNGFGADRYLTAFNEGADELELYLLNGTSEEHEINKISVKFSEINCSGAMLNNIKELNAVGQLMMVKSEGSDSQQVIVIKQSGDSLLLLLDKQGKTITYTEDLKEIDIENPTDEDISGIYTYLYDDEGYMKEDLTPIPVSLQDQDIMNYIGHLVTFSCYVPRGEQGSTANGYACDKYSYDGEAVAQLYTTDNTVIESGSYQVIGKIVGTVSHYDSSLQENVDRPVVQVEQLIKQED